MAFVSSFDKLIISLRYYIAAVVVHLKKIKNNRIRNIFFFVERWLLLVSNYIVYKTFLTL